MEHTICRVTKFEIVGAYQLRVHFDDGVSQTIKFEPVLFGELYGPLRELAVFIKVRIDPEVHALVWPNGADFDPATLHDWPSYDEETLQERDRAVEGSQASSRFSP
jgi:Protein of unknown function (DUF2442)